MIGSGSTAPGGAQRELRLILGPAGSGKTTAVLHEVLERSLARQGWEALTAPLLILLAPEQQALSLEHQLHRTLAQAGAAGTAALARTRVLSFSRLAQQLALDAGLPAAARLGSAGQRALVWQILPADRRTPARIDAQHALFTELAVNGAQPADLDSIALQLARGANAALHSQTGLLPRVQAAAQDYARYLAACAEREVEVLPPAARLPRLLTQSRLLDGAQLWLDGFAGFTGAEWHGMSGLLSSGLGAVAVALLLGPSGEDSPGPVPDPYYPARRTADRLAALAVRAGWQVERETLDELRRWPSGAPRVTLVECGDLRTEADWAVREAMRLTRPVDAGGEGLRCGEVSIIVPDMAAYAGLLDSRLRDYGLRCFLDARQPLGHHPLLVYLRTSLRLALEPLLPGISSSADAWALLGTGLLPLPAGETALGLLDLENLARLQGWTPRDWLSLAPLPGGRLPEALRSLRQRGLPGGRELRRLQALRDHAFQPVRSLAAGLAGLPEQSFAACCRLLWDTLLPDELQAALPPASDDDPGGQAVLQALANLFDDLLAALADTHLSAAALDGVPGRMSPGQLLAMLDHALAGVTLAQPPPTQDAVLVTDIVRGRQGEVRAAMLLGMTASGWPRPFGGSGVFSGEERDVLLEAWNMAQAAADSTAPWRPLHEPDFERCAADAYLAGVALSRPSELLYASRPVHGAAGEELGAAQQFTELRREAAALAVDQAALHEIALARSLADLHLARALAGGADWPGVTPHFAADWASGQRRRSNRWPALPQLAPMLLRQGPARPVLRVSPTQLETMAACPFKHFARYGLGLEARGENEFGHQQVGSIYHLLLEAISRRLMELPGPASLQEAAVADLCTEVLGELAPQLEELLGRRRAEYVRERAQLLLGERQDWLRPQGPPAAGQPAPRIAQVEASFGSTGGLERLSLPLAGVDLEVGGRIDRLDADERGRAWVVDYKLAGGSFSWRGFAAGINLQLPLYLRALQGQAEAGVPAPLVPQAAYLQPIEPLRERSRDTLTTRASQVPAPAGNLGAAAQERLSGGLLLDHTLEAAQHIATALAAWILDGVISPQPLRQGTWTACSSCDLRSVCRFDPAAGEIYREAPPVDALELHRGLAERGGWVLPPPPPPLPAGAAGEGGGA